MEKSKIQNRVKEWKVAIRWPRILGWWAVGKSWSLTPGGKKCHLAEWLELLFPCADVPLKSRKPIDQELKRRKAEHLKLMLSQKEWHELTNGHSDRGVRESMLVHGWLIILWLQTA